MAPTPESATVRWFSLSRLLVFGLAASCLWAYWPALVGMVDRWTHDPQYSHGYLVPVFALFLLWHRRAGHDFESFRPSPWGLTLVVLGISLRLAGTFFYFGWLEALSLLPCLFGICLLLGGRAALHWAWPALAFLVFMLPLPFQVEKALAHPLQRVATLASTFLLEVLGYRATSEGNVIWVNDETRIGVVEACGGLNNESIINGILLAPNGSIGFAPGLVNGEVIAGGSTIHFVSGASINQPPGQVVPVPPSFVLMGMGGVAFAITTLRARRRR
jgi:exosortase